MIVYQADKRSFLSDVREREIDELILAEFRAKTGKSVGKGEQSSWRNSLGSMANVLDSADIADDVAVAVEFVLPQSLKRIDVTLAGYGSDGVKRAVIVELKQWESARSTQQDGIVITRVGPSERPHVHPSYQAWSYAAFLRGFNEAVYEGGIDLQPCAYLHNYRRDGQIDAERYDAYLREAPLFAKGEQAKLREFIARHVPKGKGAKVLFELDHGRIRPSKALADAVRGMVQGKEEFVLLDEQKAVYEAALAAAKAASLGQKRVVIVEGGPGTGKSVVAVQLVSALLTAHNFALYVSKNAAPRKVFVEQLGGLQRDQVTLSNLFTGPDRFMTADANAYGTLVVDEAHRLTEKGGFYGNQGDHLVKDIIRSARCAIFFLDEDQRVTLKDVGSNEVIEAFARQYGASIETYELTSQFRCAGSDGYIAWLDDALEIRSTANSDLAGTAFDFQVFDDPGSMHRAIEGKNQRNKARVVAGYCWPWKSKKNPQAADVVIGDYAKRWNLVDDGSLWIVAEESIDQVGCVHTCQGLEVDYVGVIIGPDLVCEDGRIKSVPDARDRHDKTMKGFKTWRKTHPVEAAEAADRIIKNTYRTLMTRGMRGCYVYATDPALRDHLRRRAAPIAMSSRTQPG